jgi:two-component system LytT family response regulator
MPNTIKVVIIDDEPGNIVTISELLKEYCPELMIAGTASNPLTGFDLVQATRPDIVFLDIEMPFGNAFDFLDKFEQVDFEVIFITAFSNYALKAIKYDALDYILKPVDINELKLAVTKAMKRLEDKNKNSRIASILNILDGESKEIQKIGLTSIDGFHIEEVQQIMYLIADGSYTEVYIRNKKKQLVSKNLKEFEDILPASIFCRVHHSHLININFVKKYVKGRGGHVEMEDGIHIEISARKRDAFLEKFKHL